MNDKELNELVEYNQEYMDARLSEDVFGGDYTSEVELKYLKKDYDKLQSNWRYLRELIKWRPIEEYDENKYDWVLVKYYDGDYECVPTVAERRKGTNKWYDTNYNKIIFEVKYFFDMQLLDKMNELGGEDIE